jgi:hypothetical protein
MSALLLALTLSAAPFEWNVPQLVSWTEVGDRMVGQGLPLKVWAVRSKWKLDELAVHYAKRFLDAGFYVDPRQKKLPGSTLPRLTALDTSTMWSYTVMFYPEADGTTTMLLGAADLGSRAAPQVADFAAPVFPGATSATSFNLESARALSFRTRATEGEVSAFYRQTLKAAGWTEDLDRPGTFVKDGRALRVLARAEKTGGLGVVILEQPDLPLEPRDDESHRAP